MVLTARLDGVCAARARAGVRPRVGGTVALRRAWATWRAGHSGRTERHVDWLFVISASGVASLAMQVITGWQMGLFPIPGGDTLLWDRVGDAIRAGSNDIYAL